MRGPGRRSPTSREPLPEARRVRTHRRRGTHSTQDGRPTAHARGLPIREGPDPRAAGEPASVRAAIGRGNSRALEIGEQVRPPYSRERNRRINRTDRAHAIQRTGRARGRWFRATRSFRTRPRSCAACLGGPNAYSPTGALRAVRTDAETAILFFPMMAVRPSETTVRPKPSPPPPRAATGRHVPVSP